MRKLRTFLLFLAMAFAVNWAVRAVREMPREGGLSAGGSAPPFVLPVLGGGEMSSDSLRGEITVINFWATWCGPCRHEIPALQAVAEAGQAQVVSITLDQADEAVINSFVEKHGMTYPVLLGSSNLLGQYRGRGIPYTVVLDAQGQVSASYLGAVRRKTLERAIEKASQPAAG